MERVLIANRGEIAIRIAAAAASLDMESVAVFAAADADALHTAAATQAVALPEAADPIATYLQVDAIVAAAVDTGCTMVHPGYGFLSENAASAEACVAAGLTFVGPSTEALRLFGDKVAARTLADSLGIPIVPGTADPLDDLDSAEAAAAMVGYPVMLKASAGGGGRGMRAVHDPDELDEAFNACSREAEAAFGDGTVFLERLVMPRAIAPAWGGMLVAAHNQVGHCDPPQWGSSKSEVAASAMRRT